MTADATKAVPVVTVDHALPTGTPERWRGLKIAGAVVLGLWLVGLLAFSTTIYHRTNLSSDFAVYNQAWTLIGQGHLNPFDSISQSFSFLQNDFELIMWPLALIHLVYPQPVVLLWIQDVGVAGSGFVAYLWIVEYLERQKLAWWPAAGIALAVLVALIADPATYQILYFDFHVEPVSTVFVLLAGRDLWLGRHRRAWWWIGLVLLCGSFSTITLVGLGVSALLAGRSTRRQGALLIVVSLVWLTLISALEANQGSSIDNYAYLAGRTSLHGGAAIAIIGVGMLTHPDRWLHQFHARLSSIYTLIKPVGVVGLASAWGFGVPAVVLLTNSLNSYSGYIQQAFQNSAVFPFVLLGTVMVLVWLAQRIRWGWLAALLVGLLVLGQAVGNGISTAPVDIRYGVSHVGAPQAAQLRRALAVIPPQAQVIASYGIIGRFASRPAVYDFSPNATYPVGGRPVVFVFVPQNDPTIPASQDSDYASAIAYLGDHLHARTLIDADGVSVLEWQPPTGTKAVAIPTGS